MLDLLVLILVVIVLAALFARRRLVGLGRGFGSGVREFRRARAGLPPADPELLDAERSTARRNER